MHQDVIVTAHDDVGRVIRRAVATVADRVLEVTAVGLELTAVVIFRQRKVRGVVDVEIVAEGLQQLHAVSAERPDLRYLVADVAVDLYCRRGLDRHDLVAIERRRDVVGEEICAATLGGDAETEARDALLGRLRLGIELALRANVAGLLDDDDGVRHSEHEAGDVQGLARIRTLVLRLYVWTRQCACPVDGRGRALGWNVAPVESPVDLGNRNADRRASEDQYIARLENDHRRWCFHDVNRSYTGENGHEGCQRVME